MKHIRVKNSELDRPYYWDSDEESYNYDTLMTRYVYISEGGYIYHEGEKYDVLIDTGNWKDWKKMLQNPSKYPSAELIEI